MGTYAVALSGASGAIYGMTFLATLLQKKQTVYFTISSSGFTVLKEEMGLDWRGTESEVNLIIKRKYGSASLTYFDDQNLSAPIASGSHPVDGMVIIPCSMKTVASIAHGLSSTLIERAADVTLKERRPLILVPRETPLSEIHLSNLMTLARSGAHILPAMPAFYYHPKTIEDLVHFIVGRVLDILKIEHSLFTRWGS